MAPYSAPCWSNAPTRRMRDLARDPTEGLCLLRFGAGDRSYSVVPKGAQPSSELPTHVAVHDMLARIRHHYRVVVHTHPTALISLTHRYPNQNGLIRLLLCRLTPKRRSCSKTGLRAIPFLPPGTVVARTRYCRRARAVLGCHLARAWHCSSRPDRRVCARPHRTN